MTKRAKSILLLIVAFLILLSIFCVILFSGKGKDDKVKIGFIMTGAVGESGWNGMHYNGVKTACEKLGGELLVRENIPEFTGACNGAIRELAEDGAKMIILSSYGYSEEAKELVKQYPQIVFYVNSSEYHDENMTSYFARMYQARYLAGIVAGMKSESNIIGYVAAMENNEVNRGINAFTLGVKRVNPDAQVLVNWTGEWDYEAKEKEAAQQLIGAGADVLTYHQNRPNVVAVAEEAGIYSIGYHAAAEGASGKHLTAVVCDWGMVYEEIIREYMIGKGNHQDNYWIGMEAQAVGLSELSSEVTAEIRDELAQAKQELLTGKDVFSGEIYDNAGKLRCGEKEVISDEMLLEQFDWYVEGVRFYER